MKKTKLVLALIMTVCMMCVLTVAASAIDGIEFYLPMPIAGTTVGEYSSGVDYDEIEYYSWDTYVTQSRTAVALEYKTTEGTGKCGDNVIITDIRWYEGDSTTEMADTRTFRVGTTYRAEIEWNSDNIDETAGTVVCGSLRLKDKCFSTGNVSVIGGSGTSTEWLTTGSMDNDFKNEFITTTKCSVREVKLDIGREEEYESITSDGKNVMDFIVENGCYYANQELVFQFRNHTRPGYIIGAQVTYTYASGETQTYKYPGNGTYFEDGNYNAYQLKLELTLPGAASYADEDPVKAISVSPLWADVQVTGVTVQKAGGSGEPRQMTEGEILSIDDYTAHTVEAILRVAKELADNPDYKPIVFYEEAYTMEFESKPYTVYTEEKLLSALEIKYTDDNYYYYAYTIENVGAMPGTRIGFDWTLGLQNGSSVTYPDSGWSYSYRLECSNTLKLNISTYEVAGFNHLKSNGSFPSYDDWDPYINNTFKLGINQTKYNSIPENLRMFGKGLVKRDYEWKIVYEYSNGSTYDLTENNKLYNLYNDGSFLLGFNNGQTITNYNPDTLKPVAPYLFGNEGDDVKLHIEVYMRLAKEDDHNIAIAGTLEYPILSETLNISYSNTKNGAYGGMITNVKVQQSGTWTMSNPTVLKDQKIRARAFSTTAVDVAETFPGYYQVFFEQNAPQMMNGYSIRSSISVYGAAEYYTPSGTGTLTAGETTTANVIFKGKAGARVSVQLWMYLVGPDGKDIGGAINTATVVLQHTPKYGITFTDGDRYSLEAENTSGGYIVSTNPDSEYYGVPADKTVKLTVTNTEDDCQPFLYWDLKKPDGTTWQRIWRKGNQYSDVDDYVEATFTMPAFDLVITPVFLENYTELVEKVQLIVDGQSYVSGDVIALEPGKEYQVDSEWVVHGSKQDGVKIATAAELLLNYGEKVLDATVIDTSAGADAYDNLIGRTQRLSGTLLDTYGYDDDFYVTCCISTYVYDETAKKWVKVDIYNEATVECEYTCSTVAFNYPGYISSSMVKIPDGWYITNDSELIQGVPAEDLTGYAYNKDGELTMNNFRYSSKYGIAAVSGNSLVDLVINLEGSSIIETTSYVGLSAGDNGVYIYGPGRLTLSSPESYAVNAKSLSVSGAILDVSGKLGFTLQESLTINDIVYVDGNQQTAETIVDVDVSDYALCAKMSGTPKVIMKGGELLMKGGKSVLGTNVTVNLQKDYYSVVYSEQADGSGAKLRETAAIEETDKYLHIKSNTADLRYELELPEGVVLNNVTVNIYLTDNPREYNKTYTYMTDSAEGIQEIIIYNLVPGNYTVVISGDGYEYTETIDVNSIDKSPKIKLNKIAGGAGSGVTITGALTTYTTSSDDDSTAVIELYQNGEVVRYGVIASDGKSYAIYNVEPGEYIIKVSKTNHVPREYKIVVE